MRGTNYIPLRLISADEEEEAATQVHREESRTNELVATTAQQRNWRGIAIALLVILIVCALIITAIVIATPRQDSENLGDKFTFDDFIKEELRPLHFSAKWITGTNQFLYESSYGEIRLYNCSSNSSTTLMDNSTFKNHQLRGFALSADGHYLLLKSRSVQVYRHTAKSIYHIYNVHTKENPEPLPGVQDEMLQYVTWSPTGSSLVMVEGNNIFYKTSLQSEPVQLTTSGVQRLIYNGIPDWVYEEEVLSTDNAIWWSPESTYLLYAVFNDTLVRPFSFPEYGDLDQPYTTEHTVAYPKAGYPNPEFSLHIVKLSTRVLVTLQPPEELAKQDRYFTSVAWLNDQEVLITWMNRAQTFAIETVCQAANGTCRKSIDVRAESGWLDLLVPPLVSSKESRYFWILPEKEGESGNFKHVVMVERRPNNNRDKLTFLTTGTWEVSSIVGYNKETDKLFFLSPHTDPRRMHLYSVVVSTKVVTCESCHFHEKCQYFQVSMSSSADFYIQDCLGPGIPQYSLMTKDGLEVQRLEDNCVFAEKISKKALPWIKYEHITLPSGEKLWGKLLLPPVLKMEEVLTYPMVLQVYGGPGSQLITEKYCIDWYTYMTSSREVIYAFVDGRGSGGRGDKFTHAVYRQLGKLEVDDSLRAADQFGDLHYVDKDSMAIWGWSYGGYITASALARGTNTFKCGIAVAPVTDWIYYDSVYTERYMGLPTVDDNLDGYKNANVSKNATSFRRSNFMLIHGTADDNVHFQQSAQLIKALIEADVSFRLQIYTDKNHLLNTGNTRRHLYDTMEDFLVECFQISPEKFDHESQEYVKKPLAAWQKKKKMN